MKTFLDLQATNLFLNVVVNGVQTQKGLKDTLEFNVTDNVTIDGFEILPKYQWLTNSSKLIINEPFYCWYHRVSGQGWLLQPN